MIHPVFLIRAAALGLAALAPSAPLLPPPAKDRRAPVSLPAAQAAGQVRRAVVQGRRAVVQGRQRGR